MQTPAAATASPSSFERYVSELRALLAVVLVWIGLADDGAQAARLLAADATGEGAAARAFAAMVEPGRISRRVHGLVRRLLLPLEAATRRMIVAAAGLPAAGVSPSDRIAKKGPPVAKTPQLRRTHEPGAMVPSFLFAPAPPPARNGPPKRMPRFCLFDPLKRRRRRRWVRRRAAPNLWFAGDRDRPRDKPPPLPTPYDMLTDARLMRRVAALASALRNLPRQAERLARWRSRRDAGLTRRLSPLRQGRPPGSAPLRTPSRDHRDEHLLLAELHGLAISAPGRRDSS